IATMAAINRARNQLMRRSLRSKTVLQNTTALLSVVSTIDVDGLLRYSPAGRLYTGRPERGSPCTKRYLHSNPAAG
ncbi:MAG: hypothetical protein ACWGOX_05660, partial [Desulforhopalus sp.]